jgi:RNA polymerase sigma-70 factor, ECF subfamily
MKADANESENLSLFLDYLFNDNKESFNEFVKNHENWLLRIIGRFVHDKDDVDDIYQKVWISVLNHAKEYNKDKSDLKAWIYSRYVKGKLLQYLRDKKHKQEKMISNYIINDGDDVIEFIETLPSSIINPDENFERYEKNWIIRKAIKKLNLSYQDVIILYNFGNKQLEEIADMMNKEHATLRTWNRRAKIELKNFLHGYI